MVMPWARLVAAATVCNEKLSLGSNLQYTDSAIELPSDLTELVFGYPASESSDLDPPLFQISPSSLCSSSVVVVVVVVNSSSS
jgi:hypothetical protein